MVWCPEMDRSLSSPLGSKRWYVVKTQPRKEAIASAHLRRQGFETFLPLITCVTRRAGQFISRQTAFFPGYLFVQFDLKADRWRSVNGTTGVNGLIQFGDRPVPAPVGLIEQMIALASDSNEVRFFDDLAVGASVRVVGGPFDRVIGILQSTGPHERVTLLVSLMERQVPVTVSRASVIAAN